MHSSQTECTFIDFLKCCNLLIKTCVSTIKGLRYLKKAIITYMSIVIFFYGKPTKDFLALCVFTVLYIKMKLNEKCVNFLKNPQWTILLSLELLNFNECFNFSNLWKVFQLKLILKLYNSQQYSTNSLLYILLPATVTYRVKTTDCTMRFALFFNMSKEPKKSKKYILVIGNTLSQ